MTSLEHRKNRNFVDHVLFLQLCDLNLDMSISWARVCVNIYVVMETLCNNFLFLIVFIFGMHFNIGRRWQALL